jgi:hypothetical protein
MNHLLIVHILLTRGAISWSLLGIIEAKKKERCSPLPSAWDSCKRFPAWTVE